MESPTSASTQREARRLVEALRQAVIRLADRAEAAGRINDIEPILVALEQLVAARDIAWSDARLWHEIKTLPRAARSAPVIRAVAYPVHRARRRREVIATYRLVASAVEELHTQLDHAGR